MPHGGINTKTTKQVDTLKKVYRRCKRLIQGVTIVNKHQQLWKIETKGDALLVRGECTHSWKVNASSRVMILLKQFMGKC